MITGGERGLGVCEPKLLALEYHITSHPIDIYIYIYIYIYTHTHTYIHTYIHIYNLLLRLKSIATPSAVVVDRAPSSVPERTHSIVREHTL